MSFRSLHTNCSLLVCALAGNDLLVEFATGCNGRVAVRQRAATSPAWLHVGKCQLRPMKVHKEGQKTMRKKQYCQRSDKWTDSQLKPNRYTLIVEATRDT